MHLAHSENKLCKFVLLRFLVSEESEQRILELRMKCILNIDKRHRSVFYTDDIYEVLIKVNSVMK